ncbi:hypothetical protein Vadar_022069 [Vaccinium darrowii]|uniref:Uncharacterized protein n=1 Tax=Vaccinium darrowii TaxID=229202 RepID=A0ACB7X350_9ERIC|nr:hypothetical protein Vadar_022069 [Vaccinium darrowii]
MRWRQRRRRVSTAMEWVAMALVQLAVVERVHIQEHRRQPAVRSRIYFRIKAFLLVSRVVAVGGGCLFQRVAFRFAESADTVPALLTNANEKEYPFASLVRVESRTTSLLPFSTPISNPYLISFTKQFPISRDCAQLREQDLSKTRSQGKKL